MSKVQSTGAGGFRRYGKSSSKKDSSSVHRSRKSDFARLWEAEAGDPTEAAGRELSHDIDGSLEEMVDDVHVQGEALKERPTYENIRAYKESVRKFLAFVVNNTMEVETREGARFNPMKKQRKYTLVRTIDEKLEQLAAGIMKNQGAQLEILRKVEEINGLVVDLMS